MSFLSGLIATTVDDPVWGGTNLFVMEVATTLWFLAIGCSVGSFLNVVAYRMPLRMRLSSPKSHCPRCETPLAVRDNVPVLGWLWLRGRCRYCELPISPRYPIVEAVTGAVFLLVLFVEPLSGGANLPLRDPNALRGVVWIVWQTQWDLVGLYLYHVYLASVLIAIALMAIDGHPVPRRLVAWTVGVGLAFPLVWPDLHPVSFVEPRPEWLTAADLRWSGPGWDVGLSLRGLLDVLLGFGGGLLVGVAVAVGERTTREQRNVAITVALVGPYLGWQAAISVSLATAVLRSIGGWLRTTLPTPVLVGVAFLGQLVLWRVLVDVDGWPSHRGWPWLGTRVLLTMLPAVAVIAGLGVLGRRPTDATQTDEPPRPDEAADPE